LSLPSGAGYRPGVRSRREPRSNLAGLEIESVDGDICDENALARAPWPGCATSRTLPPIIVLGRATPDAIVRTNVEGTRTADASRTLRRRRARRVPSSVATLACAQTAKQRTRRCRWPSRRPVGAYKRSKSLPSDWSKT